MGHQLGDGAGHLLHRIVLVKQRSMPGLAVHRCREPRQTLLGGLHRIQPPTVGQGDGEAAHLAERVGRAVQQLRAVVDDPVRPVPTAGLPRRA